MIKLEIHHIGYLVKNMDAAIQSFELLGFQIVQNTIYDNIRKIDICFMQKDEYCVELISPASKDSVVYGLLKKYKNSPYHICYKTEDFDHDYQTLLANGFFSIDTPTPAPALQNRKVVFLTNASLGMIELLEQQ